MVKRKAVILVAVAMTTATAGGLLAQREARDAVGTYVELRPPADACPPRSDLCARAVVGLSARPRRTIEREGQHHAVVRSPGRCGVEVWTTMWKELPQRASSLAELRAQAQDTWLWLSRESAFGTLSTAGQTAWFLQPAQAPSGEPEVALGQVAVGSGDRWLVLGLAAGTMTECPDSTAGRAAEDEMGRVLKTARARLLPLPKGKLAGVGR